MRLESAEVAVELIVNGDEWVRFVGRRATMIGKAIAHYQVLEKLGEGGMGVVYKAQDTHLDRFVALKLLPPEKVADAERKRRFVQEAKSASALNHPNIIHIYDIDSAGGAEFMAMEYVEGRTLAQLIGSRELPLSEVLKLATQIADALAAAHAAGIVHRDIKPANIMVAGKGHVKVLDFGLAKLTERFVSDEFAETRTMHARTVEGTIVGTPAYMSPEQAQGMKCDARTDIFSFGSVLYEMVTGRPAFQGETKVSTLAKILEHEPRPVAELVERVPPELERIIRRCLRKDAERRFQDMDEVRLAMEDLREAPAPPTAAGTEALARARPAHKLRWAALTLGGLIATTGLALLLRLGGEPDAASRRYVPFATEAAAETMPRWSPDGKTIAYLAEVGGINQVFAKGLSTPVPVQVTKSAKGCGSPFWSADGTRIFYTEGGDLWSISVAGGEPQLRMKDAGIPSMSADGRVLAFVRGPWGDKSLWVAQTADTEPKQYKQAPFPEKLAGIDGLAVSNDGSKIAMFVDEKTGGGTGKLWVIPYPAGKPRIVPGHLLASEFAAWAPDNRHIVLGGVQNTEIGHLTVVDTDTGETSVASEGTGDERSPSVSPDGRSIAFTSGGVDYDLVEIGLGGVSSVTPLLSTSRRESFAWWAPSGSQYGYVTDAAGRYEIWVRNTSDGWGRPVVTRETEGMPDWHLLQSPRISPDGRNMAYDAFGAEHAIWIIAVTGGRAAPLDSQSSDRHAPSWSPDGNWIAYRRFHQGKWELAKAPVGGGSPVSLGESSTGNALDGGTTDWSPAGDWICYRGPDGLRLISPDGSRHRLLNKTRPLWFGFSRDGATVYAFRRSAAGQWELAATDVASGSERQARSLPIPLGARVEGFSLHPSGKSILTAIGTPRQDIWILEGFRLPGNWLQRLWGR